MLFNVTGSVLSLLSYFIYYNNFYDYESLGVTSIFLGWFLLEHVFEEYGVTVGKLFLVCGDFRVLIINVLLIMRNLLVLFSSFGILKFMVVSLLLVIGSIYRKKISLVLFSWVCIYFVLLNSFLFIDKSNSFMLLNYVLSIYFVNFLVIFYSHIWYYYIFFLRLPYLRRSDFYIKVFLTKFLAYMVLFTCFVVLLSVDFVAELGENLMQEFVLKNLMLYLFIYYLFII